MKKKLLIKKPVGKYKVGEIIQVDCDKYGIPLNQYWRNRLKDSAIDQCVEEIQPERPVSKKEDKKEEKKEDKKEEKKEVKFHKDKPLTKVQT